MAFSSSWNKEPPRYDDLAKKDNLANLALKLTDKKWDTFIKKVMAYELEEDFLPAWVLWHLLGPVVQTLCT